MAQSALASLVGTLVDGRYLVEEYLGGSMARVYRANVYGAPGSRSVVLKQLVTCNGSDGLTDAERRTLFEKEFQLLQQVAHPRVPKAIERFDDPHGRAFFAMDYVPGQSLDRFLAHSGNGHSVPLPEAQVLDWMEQLCGIVQHLHRMDVVYRDLKPGNVVATRDDEIYLIDFGIARTFKPGKRHDTLFVGTRDYTPYELLLQADQASPATDVYSLGATMYHLLTGKLPPSAFLMRSNGESALPSVRLVNPAVSADTDAIVQRATQLAPADRFGSAQEMADVLQGRRAASIGLHVRCPVCNAANRATARFCAQCGGALVSRAGAVLRVLGQSGALLEIALGRDKSEFLIGRAATDDGLYPDLDLAPLDARFISRRHAALQRTADGWSIIDLSRNGTFVNGIRIDQQRPQPLNAGDRLTIGDVSLQFEVTR